MPMIGPFFHIRGKLVYHAIPLGEGRHQGDKLDNPLGHDALFENRGLEGEYIEKPRGRVVWDMTRQCAIVYIDRCIDKPNVLQKIRQAFCLGDAFTVEHDDHYRCKRCAKALFEE